MEEARKPPVTREAALRIALAARALPKVTLPALIEQLQRRLGETIDEENLRQVTVTMLKTGFASAAHFRRVFREVMGTGPLQYRKGHKK